MKQVLDFYKSDTEAAVVIEIRQFLQDLVFDLMLIWLYLHIYPTETLLQNRFKIRKLLKYHIALQQNN